MIKLIACDLDGTVLDDNKNVDSELKEVVAKLKEKDILFTVASGRSRELLLHILDYFNLKDVPYICNNGANIFKNEELIHVEAINSEYARDICKMFHEHGIVFRMYALEDVYINGMSDFFRARMKGYSKPFIDYYPELNMDDIHVVKITADLTNHNDLADFFTKEVSKFPNTVFTKAEDNIYCVNSTNANKGAALEWVSNYMGIKMGEVMAFGDNENDLAMLKKAGVSIAVSNGEEYVKSQVTNITKDNNHNGVSCFLKEYFKDIL